jgi:CubicO group peptidase (beta-lactamase class C family)
MSSLDPAAHWAGRLHDLASQTEVPGAVLGLWVDGEETVVAHGVLSTATQVGTRADSLFQIGSITKVWTATMVMQLVDEGRLSLDSSVSEVLPGVRFGTEDASHQTQVRHLLTHTSGVDGDVFADTGRGDSCVAKYVDLLADVGRTHPLGAAYSYCNSGFVLLGRMIEVLDGRSWDESLRARLVAPLGLTETVTLPEEAILHRVAVGHREHPHQGEPVSTWALPRSLGPAGLVTASVHDVLTFARLHLDGGVAQDGSRLLSEVSVSAMQQPRFDIPSLDDDGDAIGLAWRLNRWGERRIFGHDGGTIGQLAYLRIDPEARLVACLLTNSYVADTLYERLFAEVFGEYVAVAPPTAPQPTRAGSTLDLSRHAGRYERVSRRYDVSLRGAVLHVVSTMTGDRAAIADEGPEEFDLHPVDSRDNAFVGRVYDQEPWSAVLFDSFSDGTPYLYLGGRATPKITDDAP